MDRTKQIEQSIIKKYRKNIWRKFVKGVQTYDLIQPGDKIAVCISGGKDSMLMAKLLQELKRHGKFDFGLVFLSMDPGYNEKNRERIEENAKILGIPLERFESDIFQVVTHIEKSPCYLCARMRRGFLYAKAKELGCNKIALGHHYDDVIETTLMNMLNNGSFQTMLPKLHSDNYEGMELIRPMYFIRERDIQRWVNYNELVFLNCACKFTEDINKSKDLTGSKRYDTKLLIKDLLKYNPFVEKNIFKAPFNVNVDKVIGYKLHNKEISFLDEYDEN